MIKPLNEKLHKSYFLYIFTQSISNVYMYFKKTAV